MTRKKEARRWIAAAVLIAGAALTAPPGLPKTGPLTAGGGQEVVIRPQIPLAHEVTVVLKLVQVFVTDRQGRPIEDLTRDDFTLTDNGRTIAITEFEKRYVDAKKAPAGAAVVAATPTALPEIPGGNVGPAALSRKFFLFMDFAYNNQDGAKKAKDAALRFLDTEIRANDQVGVLSYSLTRGLTVHEVLTTNQAKVRETVAALKAQSIAGRADEMEQKFWRQSLESRVLPDTDIDQPSPYQKDPTIFNWKRQESKSQAQSYILKLTEVARALRYVPGQKQLVLFSSGISNSLIYGNQSGNPAQIDDPRRFEAGDHVLRTQNEEMIKELASSNCSIFAFDVREAALVSTLFDYDDETFEGRNRDLFTVNGVHQNPDLIFKDDKVTGLYFLRRLTKSTGGKYYSNLDRYEANIQNLGLMTGMFYVLGYPVAEAWDGAYHKLEIKVKRRGVEVRAQAGFYNPRPFRDLTPLEQQLQLFDLALNERPAFQAALPATMAAIAGGGPGGPNLVVLSKIPPESAAKLSGERTEMVSFVFDENEHLVDLRRAEESLAKLKGRTIFYASSFRVPPGSYTCRLVVRDLQTGAAAVASTRAVVPVEFTSGIRLHPPLLVAPAENVAFLEGKVKEAKPAAPGRPAWAALYPFDGTRFAPLLGPIARGTPTVFAVLPCSVAGIDSPQVVFKAVFIDIATGERSTPAAIPMDRRMQNGAVIQMLALPVAGLAPGKYVIYFYAEETSTRRVSHSQTTLTIR